MKIDNCVVQHDEYNLVTSMITDCHQSYLDGDTPRNLRVEGVSGVGKSTVLKEYAARHGRYDTDEGTIVPVLYVALPSRPSEMAIYTSMLHALGDPFAYRGRTPERRLRLVKLINGCKVETLLIDEIHHLLDRGKLKTHTANADALKMLIEDLERPVVLAGAPRCFELFRINTQLRGRFKTVKHISPFSVATEENAAKLKKLARTLVKEAGFNNANFFDDDENLHRLFYATDGILRNLAELLGNAYRISERQRSTELAMPYLHDAFQLWVGGAGNKNESINPNPFKKIFSPRRLILPNELYEPSALDGDNHQWSLDPNDFKGR